MSVTILLKLHGFVENSFIYPNYSVLGQRRGKKSGLARICLRFIKAWATPRVKLPKSKSTKT